MRIAWITYDFEEYSSLHVNELVEEHDVLLVMPDSGVEGATYEVDGRVDRYSFDKPRLRQPLKQWFSVRELLKRIDEFKPDVVHFQQGHLWFNFALPTLRKRYPLVITVHDPRHHAGDKVSKKTPQWVMDYGFRQAHHAIVHGEALASQVHSLFSIAESDIHVIPHLAMGTAFESEVRDEDPNSILFFGRIYDYKGLDYLIQAQPLVNARIPDAKFVIGGRGDDFDRYQDMMQDPTRFEVHNRWISDEERGDLFQQSAVVVLPYTEATQSGVVPVAYNYSKPVIATDVGALSECVEDGVTGMLVPPRDVEALADAIVNMLSDDDLRYTMGKAGRAKIDNELSPRVVAAQTAKAYGDAYNDFHNLARTTESRREPIGATG